LLDYAESNIKASTAHIWKLVIEANIRPSCGLLSIAEGSVLLPKWSRSRTFQWSPKRILARDSLPMNST
jgi:hypothetical protein